MIDNALRSAAIDRRVSVKLLISLWNHSRPAEDNFLNSLKDISNAYGGVDIQVVWIQLNQFSNISAMCRTYIYFGSIFLFRNDSDVQPPKTKLGSLSLE